MTREELKSIAQEARAQQIMKVVEQAAKAGEFQTRVEYLLPEQKECLLAAGVTCNEIMQKDGTKYDLIWE